MSPKEDEPPKVDVIQEKTQSDEGMSDEESAGVRKRRKHGYRGYPNNPSVGGDIHTGSGFAGVGSTAGGSSGSGLITEKTRESVEELEEEEEEP